MTPKGPDAAGFLRPFQTAILEVQKTYHIAFFKRCASEMCITYLLTAETAVTLDIDSCAIQVGFLSLSRVEVAVSHESVETDTKITSLYWTPCISGGRQGTQPHNASTPTSPRRSDSMSTASDYSTSNPEFLLLIFFCHGLKIVPPWSMGPWSVITITNSKKIGRDCYTHHISTGTSTGTLSVRSHPSMFENTSSPPRRSVGRLWCRQISNPSFKCCDLGFYLFMDLRKEYKCGEMCVEIVQNNMISSKPTVSCKPCC